MNTVFLEKICRCCLNESEDMTYLFDRVTAIEPFTFDANFTYSDLIYMCTNVKCDLDVVDTNGHIVELPRNVCECCLQELRAAFIFRRKCENSEHLLREQTAPLSNNQYTEEVVEFEQTDDHKKCARLLEINVVGSDTKEHLQNDGDYVYISQEKSILVAINEPNALEIASSEVGIEVANVAINSPQGHQQHIISSVDDPKQKCSHLCETCEQRFHLESDLQSHIRKQHQEKKYKCSECPKEFHVKKGFLVHLNHHRDQKAKKKFLCSTCGVLFTTKKRLKIHVATHTGEKNNHICSECDKQFSSESRLRCHIRTHTGEKPYRCDQCELTFAQGNALRCHKRIHTGEKPYECRFCKKRFTQNTILKTHMTLHTGKKIKCPDCDKLFSRASNLILHRREHTGEKPYECSRCPNRYKQKSHLDRHMDTHLGIKHICEICQKVYSKPWSLKVHMFTHSKIKPHKCSVCETEFTRRDKYKHHLKSVHGLTSIENPNDGHITTNSLTEKTQ